MDHFPVLHALSVKGFPSPDAIRRFSGLEEPMIATSLERLCDDDHVRHRGGRLDAWSLTPRGRVLHHQLLASEVSRAADAPGLRRSYRRFVACDRSFKQLCATWQRDGRSAVLVRRLDELHGELVDALGPAVEELRRLGRYPDRLAAARDRVVAGDDTALARPLTDSYHDIWMELHEDLLQTLGLAARGVSQ